MSELNKLVKATLKRYGDDAPAHFGIKKTTLDGYMKRGKYPLALIEKILYEQKDAPAPPVEEPPPQPAPPQPMPQPRPTPTPQGDRVEQIVKYIQGTVDIYIRQFSQRIGNLEKQYEAMRQAQLRQAGMPNLARPDQGVPVEQVFTTNPHAAIGVNPPPLGNALDTGIAPTKDQVDAQANMTIIEGVPIPGGQLARPADYIPNQPSFGFGWNIPRPRK